MDISFSLFLDFYNLVFRFGIGSANCLGSQDNSDGRLVTKLHNLNRPRQQMQKIVSFAELTLLRYTFDILRNKNTQTKILVNKLFVS